MEFNDTAMKVWYINHFNYQTIFGTCVCTECVCVSGVRMCVFVCACRIIYKPIAQSTIIKYHSERPKPNMYTLQHTISLCTCMCMCMSSEVTLNCTSRNYGLLYKQFHKDGFITISTKMWNSTSATQRVQTLLRPGQESRNWSQKGLSSITNLRTLIILTIASNSWWYTVHYKMLTGPGQEPRNSGLSSIINLLENVH